MLRQHINLRTLLVVLRQLCILKDILTARKNKLIFRLINWLLTLNLLQYSQHAVIYPYRYGVLLFDHLMYLWLVYPALHM